MAATPIGQAAVSEKQLAELAQRRDNRRCADCNKPSPTFVNLSLGSFVCIECSGPLREFGFRLKGIGLSTFTPAEVGALESMGGNKRCNEVWLCKHPDPDKASPGYDKTEQQRRFLVKKYKDKAWYDASAPVKASPPGLAADVITPVGTPLGTPQSGGLRKRAESGRGALSTGEPSHRSLLIQASRSRSGSKEVAETAAAGDDIGDDSEDDDDDEDEDEGLDEATKALRRRQRIKVQITAFYKVHNPEKSDSVDVFVEWVMYHGMAAFNKKLRERYGTDIAISNRNLRTKKDAKDRKERKERAAARKAERLARPGPSGSIVAQAQRLAALELAHDGRTRAGSTNPFDDDHDAAAAVSVAAASSSGANPFDELRFL